MSDQPEPANMVADDDAESLVPAPASPTIDDPASATPEAAPPAPFTEAEADAADTIAARILAEHGTNGNAAPPTIRPPNVRPAKLCNHEDAERYAVAAGKAAFLASDKATDEKMARAMDAYGQIVDGMRAEIIGSMGAAIDQTGVVFNRLSKQASEADYCIAALSNKLAEVERRLPPIRRDIELGRLWIIAAAFGTFLALAGAFALPDARWIYLGGAVVCFVTAGVWWRART